MDGFSVARLERMARDQLHDLRQQLKHAEQQVAYWSGYDDRLRTWADRAAELRREIARRERAC